MLSEPERLRLESALVAAGGDRARRGEPFCRHYRLPAAGRRYLRGFLAFCSLVVLGSLLDNQSGISPAVIAVPVCTGLAVVGIWGERLMTRGGMYETAGGLKVVHGFGTSLFPWERIARFERSHSRPTSRVVVVGMAGERAPIIGTAQGARIVWDGGATKDIVGELNQRLAMWRASTPAGEASGD